MARHQQALGLLCGLLFLTASSAFAQTPPTISDIANMKAVRGVTTNPMGFTIGDAETAAGALTVSGSSSNTTILPNASIVFGGSGADRTIELTPAANQTGQVTVTVTVSDGTQTAQDTFVVTVIPPPTLYIATMRPKAGVTSPGSGSATLQLSGDETEAVLRFSFSNLTTPVVSQHLHANNLPGQPAGAIVFDIDDATPAMDGSRTWVITAGAGGTPTVAQQVTAIKTGNCFINIHSEQYPAGEIEGFFSLATGSTTFTPPAPPPAFTLTKPNDAEASRFLMQATFGANLDTIAEAKLLGYDGFLSQQFFKPTRTLTSFLTQRQPSLPLDGTQATGQTTFTVEDYLRDRHVAESWWRASLTAPDQLRHRVASAYMQIFVVSFVSDDIGGDTRAYGMASYYDMLAQNAFGNYRTILEKVTLNPMMGRYLDMKANRYISGRAPNENYAREALQLLGTGVYLLHPDGTLILDASGQPIPVYNQDCVEGFAHVFTGWDDNTTVVPDKYIQPMKLTNSNHSPVQKRLLSYSGNYAAGSPDRFVINSVNNANGTAELKMALDNIFNHPSTPPFICKQLIQRLVTANPSPGYVYRVSQKFVNNGAGVRGDMRAVIRAILLDYEARSTDLFAYQGFGKLKEPIVAYAQMGRAFKTTSVSGFWIVGDTNTEFQQRPFYSPTVFNFYEPGYVYSYNPAYAGAPGVPPGQQTTLADQGLVSPEFQILTDTTTIRGANLFEDSIRNTRMKRGTDTVPVNTDDVRFDFAREQAMAGDINKLLDHLNTLLLAGQMTPRTRTIIANHLATIPAASTLLRVQAAVHLIVTSPEYAVQR